MLITIVPEAPKDPVVEENFQETDATGPALRIGLLVGSQQMQKFVVDVIRQLKARSYVQLCLILLPGVGPDSPCTLAEDVDSLIFRNT